MTLRLRYRPWWFGSFGVVKPLKTTFAMLHVAPNGMLTGPGTASDEPEKSASISSPSIVTRTARRIMSSLIPSSSSQSYALQLPSGRAATAARASRSPWSSISSTTSSTTSRPNFS